MNPFFASLKTEKLLDYVSKQQETKRSHRISEIAFTLCVIAAFILFALKPTMATISDLLGKINSKKILVSQMDIKIKNIVQAQDNFAKIQDNYPIILSCVPSRPSYYQAATQLQKAGEKHSINFNKLSFNLDKDNTNFSITISNQNDFIAFLETIKTLSQSRRPLTIDTFSFSLPKSNTASASANSVNFALNTKYYFLEKENEKK